MSGQDGSRPSAKETATTKEMIKAHVELGRWALWRVLIPIGTLIVLAIVIVALFGWPQTWFAQPTARQPVAQPRPIKARAALSLPGPASVSASAAPNARSPEPVNILSVLEAYASNEVKAKHEFEDRPIKILGGVERVESNDGVARVELGLQKLLEKRIADPVELLRARSELMKIERPLAATIDPADVASRDVLLRIEAGATVYVDCAKMADDPEHRFTKGLLLTGCTIVERTDSGVTRSASSAPSAR